MMYSKLMFKTVAFTDAISGRRFIARPIDIVLAYQDLFDIVKSVPGLPTSLNTWYTLVGLSELFIGDAYTFTPKTEIVFNVNKITDRIVISFKNLERG